MSDIVIQANNISKAYQLGDFGTGTLSRDIERWWAMMRGKEDPFLKIGESNDRTIQGASDIVWSLKDINFEIGRGDAVGIIGRNGAGKSTLLKLLSRVTVPTTGEINVKGRIASLLEVGTGFHPELTGRENIFLNGAILGMRKAEIRKQFDSIVAFAGVERYIDTPVKRYSSGMYVRLAFAVAAHLESEILIVDEVLAVGDAEFQKKCLGKMGEISKGQGRTVLFVSHNMGSVIQLCNKGILLKNGSIELSGLPQEVTQEYLFDNEENQSVGPYYFIGDATDMLYFIKAVELLDDKATIREAFSTTEKFCLSVSLCFINYHPSIEIAINLFSQRDFRVFTIHERLFDHLVDRQEREVKLNFEFPSEMLAPGTYTWVVVIHIPHQQAFHVLKSICKFTVTDGGTKLASYEGTDIGVILPKYKIVK
ncbi:ABC transporter ATP-binding protein [Mucilaginibacter sp. HD30]